MPPSDPAFEEAFIDPVIDTGDGRREQVGRRCPLCNLRRADHVFIAGATDRKGVDVEAAIA